MIGSAAAAGEGVGGVELSLAECVSLLNSFARHPGASDAHVRMLVALTTGQAAEQLAESHALLVHLSSVLVHLHGSSPHVESAALLLRHFSASLAKTPLPPAPGALEADILAKVARDAASLPASDDRRAVFDRVSLLCRSQAPNLFDRRSARVTLQAFAYVDLEGDPVFGHLYRIARGRAALPTSAKQQEELRSLMEEKRGLF